MGIGVSKKLGNTPRRNRVKRWAREAVRTLPLDGSKDQVLIVGAGAGATFSKFSECFNRLVQVRNEKWGNVSPS